MANIVTYYIHIYEYFADEITSETDIHQSYTEAVKILKSSVVFASVSGLE